MSDQIFDEKTHDELPGQDSGLRGFFRNTKLIIPLIVAVVLFGGIFGYFFVKGLKPAKPTSTNVQLVIKGPDRLTSDNEAEYDITYHNGENADLVNISLEMFYPSGFSFKSSVPTSTSSAGQNFNLPILKSGQDAKIVIRGKLSGSTGEDKQIEAKLHYSLSNFNSEFLVDSISHTTILPPNLTMDINGPVDVVNGQDTTFTVTYTNVSGQDFDNQAVQLTYPEGFSFTSSNPAATKLNNYWLINKLPQNSSGSIEITGSFSGDSQQEKLVKADLGQIIKNTFALQISSTATFKIIPSSLSLTLSSETKNYINLGDTVNYKLNYINQGNIGLSNLVINVTLAGPALDLAHIYAPNAIVTGNALTWKAATYSPLAVLAPNETGEIDFSIPIKSTLSTNLQNQSINASATISSAEMSKPTKAGDLNLKLISQLALSAGGNYVSGAAPMQIGQPTLFNMNFALTNSSNDLSEVAVVASLPLPSSAWNNVIVPDSEKDRLSFDPGSGKITWRIADLPAFTGKFSPALKVSFQLLITPAPSDQGKAINLLTSIQASGTDTFVGQDIQSNSINTVSTSSIGDSVLNSKGSSVQ